jgi:hypothetical protein
MIGVGTGSAAETFGSEEASIGFRSKLAAPNSVPLAVVPTGSELAEILTGVVASRRSLER